MKMNEKKTKKKYIKKQTFNSSPGQLFEKPTEQRVCLNCQKKFLSFGNFNRICGKCKNTKEFSGSSLQPETGMLPK